MLQTACGRGCVNAGTEGAVSFVVANFGSGGGFSRLHARPAYQAAAVEAYLNSSVPLPPSAVYHASGRDISNVDCDFVAGPTGEDKHRLCYCHAAPTDAPDSPAPPPPEPSPAPRRLPPTRRFGVSTAAEAT